MPSPPLGETGLVLDRITLPQPFPFHIDPEPSPVVGLIAEALGLRCEVLGLLCWNAPLVDMDGHPFLESLDVRDEAWIGSGGSAHQLTSQSGSLMPSTISRFCASLMPPE